MDEHVMTDEIRDHIDSDLLARQIDELGEIGTYEGGGLYRGVFSPGWAEAVDTVRGWMAAAGLVAWQDQAGNLVGRLEGAEPGGVVMTGSHIDTVKGGGRYDGALGIHAALAAVRALVSRHGRPRKSIDVLAICEEEGSRFHSNFWGARAICGRVDPAEADTLRDRDGVTMREAMASCGFDAAEIGTAARTDIDAFVELHIEQGRILETEGYPIGVVEAITGQRHLRVTVEGRQDHAGTTPMDLRRDAMAGAAEMIATITDQVAAAGRPGVATCGMVDVAPGAINIVPREVRFTVDTRHSDATAWRAQVAAVEEQLRLIAERRGLGLSVTTLIDHAPVGLDGGVQERLRQAASAEGLRYLDMPSGAGHDSQVIAKRFPTGMVFVPSRDGRSHTPDEFTPIEQVVPGVAVLARTLHGLAYDSGS